MNEYDAQIGRQMSTEAEVTHAQAISDEDDLAGGLRGLSALVTAGLTIDDLLAAVAGFAAQAIPGADGAGVTLIRPTGTTMGIAAWSVTEPFVREIDIIQYETVQQGPCITCMQVRVAVVSGSLGSDHRWPRFGGRVGRLGVASSLSLPLLIADQVVGSINCYAYATDVFGEHAVRLGTQFAGPAAVSVYNAQLIAEARDTAAQLQQSTRQPHRDRPGDRHHPSAVRQHRGRGVRQIAADQSNREHQVARDRTSRGRRRGTPRPRPARRTTQTDAVKCRGIVNAMPQAVTGDAASMAAAMPTTPLPVYRSAVRQLLAWFTPPSAALLGREFCCST